MPGRTSERGDSLSAIGAKTGVDWKTIAALNDISSPYTIIDADFVVRPPNHHEMAAAGPGAFLHQGNQVIALLQILQGIGSAGCGPTAAAMLIETLTGETYTPVDACAWSVAHGYKALKAGTYYAYFAPQFAEFGIKCWQLSWTNGYHRGSFWR